MGRREYDVSLRVNSRQIRQVIIDDHYESKHKTSIDDELILRLVALLDGGHFPVADRKEPYDYFVVDRMVLDRKFYRLIWVLEDDQMYIGVVNAHRRR